MSKDISIDNDILRQASLIYIDSNLNRFCGTVESMFGLGLPEMMIIGLVAVLVFGPKKIPEIGGALGKSLRGFKEELENPDNQEENQDESS